jgi:glutamate-1-semialdehyde 2,1-aminomutase
MTMNFQRSNALRARFHAAIPGGSHTYAKGDDQYPEHAAPYLVRGEGCHVWDVDGNEFIEYGMGLRAVTLGHAYRPVIEAAARQMALGMNFTRPTLLELECAEALLRLIEGSDMVKFAKNGSDVTTAAVKLARAYTGRDLVAICAQQPFLSVDDWFIGVTPMGAGVPKAVRDLTLKFDYNELIRHGILAPSFVVSAAHSDADIDATIAAVDAALVVYRRALDHGISTQLNGRPVKPVMRTLN